MLRKKVWLTEDVPVTHTNVGNHVSPPPPKMILTLMQLHCELVPFSKENEGRILSNHTLTLSLTGGSSPSEVI